MKIKINRIFYKNANLNEKPMAGQKNQIVLKLSFGAKAKYSKARLMIKANKGARNNLEDK